MKTTINVTAQKRSFLCHKSTTV